MGDTKIQWTDKTWSPLRVRVRADAAAIAKAKGYASLVQIAERMAGHVGPHCEAVSHGCDNCYAGSNNHRCLPSNGTGLPYDRRSRDLVEAFVDENILKQPLKWRKPQRIFVENQSDLFGDWYTDEQIDRVFTAMASCPEHTFQVLTKRPERMKNYLLRRRAIMQGIRANECPSLHSAWPDVLPNVWLGVSVEDQETADERISPLLRAPAAVRFVSYEPVLGPVDFYLDDFCLDTLAERRFDLNWIIVGGESGPGARPFDIAWARQTVEQCKSAGVACFVKQLGARSFGAHSLHKQIHHRTTDGNLYLKLKDRKGGDMAEWPEDLRVREFPNV